MQSLLKLLLFIFFSVPLIGQPGNVCAQSGIHFELGFQNNILKDQDFPQKWNDTLFVNSLREERYSIEVGVGYQYELSKRVTLRGTALYSSIFHPFSILKREPKDFQIDWINPITVTQRRIAIPILLQYKLKNLMVGGGIESSIKLKVVSDPKLKSSEIVQRDFPELISVDEAINGSFRPITWSYTAILSYEILKKVTINFQYSTNISGQLKTVSFNGEQHNVSSPVRRLSFRIGYLLPLANK